MNKLVKRLTGILAAGLMLMAAGCGGRPQEPEQSTPETTSAPVVLPEASVLYAAALEKIEAEKSVACSLEMEMIQSSAGTTITVPVKAKIEAQEKEGVTLLHMLMNMSMMGQTHQYGNVAGRGIQLRLGIRPEIKDTDDRRCRIPAAWGRTEGTGRDFEFQHEGKFHSYR